MGVQKGAGVALPVDLYLSNWPALGGAAGVPQEGPALEGCGQRSSGRGPRGSGAQQGMVLIAFSSSVWPLVLAP